MINTQMRSYNYFTFGGSDEYGQAQLSASPTGSIKMSINLTSQSIQDNINYKNSSYIGFTYDSAIDDSYVIEFGKLKLKVLYVNSYGRIKQVFMNEY